MIKLLYDTVASAGKWLVSRRECPHRARDLLSLEHERLSNLDLGYDGGLIAMPIDEREPETKAYQAIRTVQDQLIARIRKRCGL